jgi:eukaryotic-like serine/threonine-protein kinase
MSEHEQLTIAASDFVEAVRRSRVVDEARFDAALSELGMPHSPAALKEEPASSGLEESAKQAPAVAKHLIDRGVLTRYQAKELLQGRFRRLRMEHFVIRDLLGVGGMGAVFRAYDQEHDREVALKVLSERFKHDAGMRARFRLEARAGMHLDHSGIVKTYELGVTDDVFGEVDYASMELFEGIALHELVGIMGPLPVNAACDIACQAGDALDYLHAQGMVHRDVKPDNVLVDRTGAVKIIDFGLTLINDASDEEPAEGEEFSLAMIFGHDCLGTPDYMPPEQADDSRAVDARADIYSLGCTLFVALTAKRPFTGKSGTELIQQHRTQPPPDPRQVIDTIPPEVARAVLRMMAKSPDDRLRSMREVREELHRFATRRRIDFSFSRLTRNRMALAIRQGRISQRRTSTAMRLSTAGRQTSARRAGSGTGSAAALQATGSPRDTAIARLGSGSRRSGVRGQRVGEQSATTAASGAENLLQGMSGAALDEQAAGTGAMLRLPDGGLFRLARANVVIGRSRDESDLWIDDKRLSGRHCRLMYDGRHWQVIDLESRNGTSINGRRVSMAPLFGGDKLTLSGEVTLAVDWSQRRPRAGWGPVFWPVLAFLLVAIAAGACWFLS